MRYVDGYVLPIPSKNLPAYRKLARKAAKVWRDHGALQYCEAAADDIATKFGIPFGKLVKPKRGETIVFAWIVFKSRRDRDRVNALVMKDPRIAGMEKKAMPFDPKRMTFGGFKIMVDS